MVSFSRPKIIKGIWNMVSRIFNKYLQDWWHEQVEWFTSQQALLTRESLLQIEAIPLDQCVGLPTTMTKQENFPNLD